MLCRLQGKRLGVLARLHALLTGADFDLSLDSGVGEFSGVASFNDLPAERPLPPYNPYQENDSDGNRDGGEGERQSGSDRPIHMCIRLCISLCVNPPPRTPPLPRPPRPQEAGGGQEAANPPLPPRGGDTESFRTRNDEAFFLKKGLQAVDRATGVARTVVSTVAAVVFTIVSHRSRSFAERSAMKGVILCRS